MIQWPADTEIFLLHDPISFRSGINGTSALVRNILEKEPMDGAFFVFRNRKGHMLRILYYDGSGFWLCTKRLSVGTFIKAWPKSDESDPSSRLLARELQILIWGGDPKSCVFPEIWRKIA